MTDATRLAAIRQQVWHHTPLSREDSAWLLDEFETAVAARQQAEQQRDYFIEVLAAARDELVAFQKQAGWLPAQGGYSATMMDAERRLAKTVADLDKMLAYGDVAGLSAKWTALEQRAQQAEQERDKWFVECDRLANGLAGAFEEQVCDDNGELRPADAVDAAFRMLDELQKQFEYLKPNGSYNWKLKAEAAEQQVTALTGQLENLRRDYAPIEGEIEILQAQVAALRAALERYGAHPLDDCEKPAGGECTCGLDAALAGSRAPTTEQV